MGSSENRLFMKTKLFIFAIVILFKYSSIQSQSLVSLNDLYSALEKNHPLVELKKVSNVIALDQNKINKETNLPQASLNGQATWQSDVTQIPIKFPGIDIPTPPKDQYRFLLDINQSLYDGGLKKSMTDQIAKQSDLEQANTDVLIYTLKENICKAYYGARMADLSIDQLNLLIDDLNQKQTLLASQIEGGIASGYQSSALKVKIMEAHQAKEDALKQKANAIQILNSLTLLNLHTDQTFKDKNTSAALVRPEYTWYDAQKKIQIAAYDISKTKWQPKLQAFVQLGYGRPGLNLISNDFKGYSILGLRGQWNLSNLYLGHSKKENSILQNNLSKIDIQQQAFELQQKIKADQQINDVSRYESLLLQDDEIITLYDQVLQSSKVRLEQGISNINEYTTDANNLTQAKIKKDMHETLLLQAKELLNLNKVR